MARPSITFVHIDLAVLASVDDIPRKPSASAANQAFLHSDGSCSPVVLRNYPLFPCRSLRLLENKRLWTNEEGGHLKEEEGGWLFLQASDIGCNVREVLPRR